MLDKEAVRGAMKTAMKKSGMRQVDLAEKLGIEQSSVSGNMNRSRIGADVLIRMMNAMGYKIVAGKEVDGILEPHFEITADDKRE